MLVLVLGIIGIVAPMSPTDATERILYGITSRTGFSLPHYVAEDLKLYEAEGLAVETYVVGSAAGVVQQVAAGSLNMAQVATDQAMRALIQGVPIRIVAGAVAMPPFRMLASKSLKGWSDLKGKLISVGGKSDVTLYFLRVMARKNGLKDSDYDLIYGGGTPNRFAQLVSGAVDAAMLTNPQDFMALQQGYVDLGSVSTYVPAWSQNNMVVDTRWAETHRDAIRTFLKVYIRATRIVYDPARRAEVVSILAKHTNAEPDVAQSTYELLVREKVIAPDAELQMDGLKANLDALLTMGEIDKLPAMDSYLDASYLTGLAP